MKPRKRKIQPWEPEIFSWFNRHNIDPHLRDTFITFLFKKKQNWDLELMREMVNRKKS